MTSPTSSDVGAVKPDVPHDISTRVATVEAGQRTLFNSIERIEEAVGDIRATVHQAQRPQYGLLIACVTLAFTVVAAFVGLLGYFYADKQADHGRRLDAVIDTVNLTSRTRFTDSDGKHLADTHNTDIRDIREMIHHHESTGGHAGALQRLQDAEAALIHRRDEADRKFLRLEERVDDLALKRAERGR